MADLATLLKQQMEGGIARQLDAAVMSGDTAAARAAAKSFADLQLASAPQAPAGKKPPTPAEIKAVLEKKVDWFGVDPRKTEKMMTLGRMMDPTRFDTPEAFADQLVKFYEEETKPARRVAAEDDDGASSDDDAGGDDSASDDDAGDEDEQPERGARRTRKNGTPQPELNGSRGSGASNLRSAFQTGDIKHLPRAAADDVRKAADKFTHGRDEKARAAYIKNAVTARARADLIAAGKFDPKTNTLKK